MTKIYEVWTFDGCDLRSFLFRGSKRDCNAYVKQAIMKGQDPDFLVVLLP